MQNRRAILKGAAATMALGVGCSNKTTTPPSTVEAAALDAGLARLHDTDLEYAARGTDGLSNHGPMAAEALETMAYADRIEPFLDHYVKRLRPFSAAPAFDWADGVDRRGDHEQGPAWVATVHARIDERGPAAVVAELVPELLPGAMAAAVHGPLRAAHAWRAWRRSDTAVRARELAFGLGYWASRYQELPGVPGREAVSGRRPFEALASVRVVPESERSGDGLILDQVRVLDHDPSFAAAVDAFDPRADEPSVLLSELTSAAARLYMTGPQGRFMYIHALTGTSAVRLLTDGVPALLHAAAAGYAFQAVAALYAINGTDTSWAELDPGTPEQGPDELARRAASSRDDHTIKFVEACLREYAVSPRPEYLTAASHRLGVA